MSGTSSVPTISYTDRGYVAPAESAIVAGLDADYSAAFGGNLNTDPSTPAGQLITSTAAVVGDANDQAVLLFNSVDPAYASGRMQDAIARIYFLERDPALSTVAMVACTGLTGAVIPVNATVQDGSGNLYLCTESGTVPIGGTITLPFSAAVPGPLAVPASVAIYQAIPGWNTTAVVSGIVGNAVESRATFEARRAASVAANGAGFLPAIAGTVAKVPGVIDWYVTENDTGSAVTVGGVSLAANSLYVCVAGGAAADIAQAIWTKKPPGCGYTGNTTVTVSDTNSGYSYPYPSYSVTYETPTGIACYFTVTLSNNLGVPSNAATLIGAAIYAAFNGQDGGPRARIGSIVFASRFYASVAALGAWAQIISIQIGSNANPAASFTGSIAGTALTVSSGTGIAAGQFVFGVGVAPGTLVVSGSGTSWVVSITQTVASEAMTTAAANQNDITMKINQWPLTNAANVNVVLV